MWYTSFQDNEGQHDSVLWITLCLLCVLDRQAQLERGDGAAQELVNSLQVLEVMAGAMAPELKPLVRLLIHQDSYCVFIPVCFYFRSIITDLNYMAS